MNLFAVLCLFALHCDAVVAIDFSEITGMLRSPLAKQPPASVPKDMDGSDNGMSPVEPSPLTDVVALGCSGCSSGYQCCGNGCCRTGYTGCCWDDTKCCYSGTSGGTADDDSSDCFAGDELVTLESGMDIRIENVKVGDRVLAYDGKEFIYSDVVFIPHPKNTVATNFIKTMFESGRTVSVTPNHLVPVVACEAAVDSGVMTAAKNVQVGMCVQTVNGIDKVDDLEVIQGTGRYTYVTGAEYAVVNGVVFSPFAYFHTVIHMFYAIHRIVYDMLGKEAMESAVALKVVAFTTVVGNYILKGLSSTMV